MDNMSLLQRRLNKIEAKLNKCRVTKEDGWQTMKRAKKSRNWDYYALKKHEVLKQIFELENKK